MRAWHAAHEEALLLVRLHSEACSARPLKALRFRVAEAPRLHAARVSAHTPHVLALHLPLSQVGSGVGVCALHCVATSATCLVERSSGTGSQSSLPEANKNASLNRHWQLCSCAAVTPERAQAEALCTAARLAGAAGVRKERGVPLRRIGVVFVVAILRSEILGHAAVAGACERPLEIVVCSAAPCSTSQLVQSRCSGMLPDGQRQPECKANVPQCTQEQLPYTRRWSVVKSVPQ